MLEDAERIARALIKRQKMKARLRPAGCWLLATAHCLCLVVVGTKRVEVEIEILVVVVVLR